VIWTKKLEPQSHYFNGGLGSYIKKTTEKYIYIYQDIYTKYHGFRKQQ
jgi:hypothetical protein